MDFLLNSRQHGNINWLARSCDRGFRFFSIELRGQNQQNNPLSIDGLKHNIRQVIAEIVNFTLGVIICRRSTFGWYNFPIEFYLKTKSASSKYVTIYLCSWIKLMLSLLISFMEPFFYIPIYRLNLKYYSLNRSIKRNQKCSSKPIKKNTFL